MSLTPHNNGSSDVRIGQLVLRFLIDGPVSDASLTMFELTVPSGARVPAAHIHDAFDETIYGQEGILTMTLEGKEIEVGPGDVLYIPRGAAHRFDNPLPATARVLAVITPGILGSAYFRELAALIAASAGGPPDHAAIAEVMLRYGLSPLAQ